MRNWATKIGGCSKKESKSIFEASRWQSTRNWCDYWRKQSHLGKHELARGSKDNFLRHFHLYNQYLLRAYYVLWPMKNTGYTVVHKADIVPCPCGAGSLAGTLRKKKNHTCICLRGRKKRSTKFFLRKWLLSGHLKNK